MMSYLLIGYRADSVDTCRGCVMETSSSDFVAKAGLEKAVAVREAAELLMYEGLGSYDVSIVDSDGYVRFHEGSDALVYWKDVDESEDPEEHEPLDDEVAVAKDRIRQARLDAKAAADARARAETEARAQRSRDAAEERDRKEFARLTEKFGGSTV